MKRSFNDQMRHLIESSGQSRYAISKATDIDQAILSRFMHGKGGLSPSNLDKLAEYLGWEIRIREK
jgi:hypothetical protein